MEEVKMGKSSSRQYEIQYKNREGDWSVENYGLKSYPDVLTAAEKLAEVYRHVQVVRVERTETVTSVWRS